MPMFVMSATEITVLCIRVNKILCRLKQYIIEPDLQQTQVEVSNGVHDEILFGL